MVRGNVRRVHVAQSVQAIVKFLVAHLVVIPLFLDVVVVALVINLGSANRTLICLQTFQTPRTKCVTCEASNELFL